MAQVVTRDGQVMMITTVDYPDYIVRDMKKSGYKITQISEEEIPQWQNGVPKRTRRSRTSC